MQRGAQSRRTHLSLHTEERLISLTAHPSHADSTGDSGSAYMHTVFSLLTRLLQRYQFISFLAPGTNKGPFSR